MQSGIGKENTVYLLTAVRKRLVKLAVGVLLPMFTGFALARTDIPGGMYPFGAAFAAAAPGGSVAAAMIGILLGFILPGSGAETLRCAASALAVAGIKWALAELKPVKDSPFFSPAAAFAGVVLTGMVVTSAVGAAISYDLASYVAEGALAAACAYFFGIAEEGRRRWAKHSLSMQHMYGAAVTACVLCIPLCRITVFGFSPFTAVLAVAAVAAAHRLGAAGGAAAGVALGTVLALADGRFHVLGVFAAAGLLAAVFASLGSVAVSSVFFIGSVLGVLASGSIDIRLIAETALACIAFPIIKPERLSFIFDAVCSNREPRGIGPSEGYIAQRLNDAARGLEDASATVLEVSERLDRIESPKADMVCRRATEEMCADCAISRFCWETARDETQALFDSAASVLRQDGRLTRRNMPPLMRTRCARWDEMTARINALYAGFVAGEAARRRVAQVRRAVSAQMCGCSRMLDELAKDSCREENRTMELSALAARTLDENGFEAEDVCCACLRDGSVSVSLTLREREEDDSPESDAALILSDALEVSFGPPQTERSGGTVLIKLYSRPEYSVVTGAAQHSRGGNRLCGDAYTVVEQPGVTHVILADGMGTGGRAAVDAAMACDLMERLLTAGFGEQCAMEMVNSAMQLSSEDESLVTLDCVRVDVYTGEVTLYKAGAAATYILRNDRVVRIDADSLPLGIMGRVDSSEERIRLEAGDVIVMASDGAEDGDDWIGSRLEQANNGDMQRLARDILSLAAARCAGGEDDDITVVAVALERYTDDEEAAAA